MQENFFITGTSNHLIIQLGSMKKPFDGESYFHTVTSNNHPKTEHVSNFSAFSAPLICAYAKSNLKYINNVLMFFRIPIMPALSIDDKEKQVEKSFQTEWFFCIDLIRQSLLLLSEKQGHSYSQQGTEAMRHGRLYICIPQVDRTSLNDAQKVYNDSFVVAIRTMIKELNTAHKIILIMIKSDNSDKRNASKILEYIKKIDQIKTRKRIFFQETFSEKIKRLLKNIITQSI